MSDRATQPVRPEPLIDRPGGRITGTGRLIVLAFGLVGVSIGFTLMSPDRAQPFVLGLLAMLAVIGVFTLFAGAIGLVRFGGRGAGRRPRARCSSTRWARACSSPTATAASSTPTAPMPI